MNFSKLRRSAVAVVLAAATSAGAAPKGNPKPVPVTYWDLAQQTHNFVVGNLLSPWSSYAWNVADKSGTDEWHDASQIDADATMVRYGDTRYVDYMNNTF